MQSTKPIRTATGRKSPDIAAFGYSGLGRGGIRLAQDATPAQDSGLVDLLNYLLGIEQVQASFYRVGLKKFDAADFEALGYQGAVRDSIAAIGGQENDHVTALTELVGQLGGDPVESGEYDFEYRTLLEFLQLAPSIEQGGLAAYGGALQFLKGEREQLTTILTIQGVEARHCSYMGVVNGTDPFPDAFERPVSRDELLKAIA
jgi:hypothetical protein